jgi:hypothetical protein
MKMLLCAVVALTSLTAFAQKSMVTLSGYETGDHADRSLDFSNKSGNEGTDRVNQSNFAINYAYAVTDTFQVGASYKKHKHETDGDIAEAGDDSSTIGLQVIYNFAHRLTDTCYAALHYDMTNSKDSEFDSTDDGSKTKTLGLEYGHRFLLGKLGGMHFNYSPSATLAFGKTSPDGSGDDTSTTTVSLNFVKFDLLF